MRPASEIRNRNQVCNSETSLARFLHFLGQPSFNQFLLKAPLATNFKSRELLLGQQPIDGEFVHVEVFRDFLKRKQRFRGLSIILHSVAANAKARYTPVV